MIDSEEIVRLATVAAGQLDQHWQNRVVAAVPKIAALFAEPRDEHDPNSLINVATKVMAANVFTAEYRGHELDDKPRADGGKASMRVFVKLYDENNQGSDYLDEDGCQTVRTEPVWSATGRSMKRILDNLERGQKIVCWRFSEQIDRTKKVGLLVHVEPLGRRRDSPGRPASPPAGERRPAGDDPQTSPAAGGGEPASPPPAASPGRIVAPSDDNAAIVELELLFNNLTSRQRVAYGRLCHGHGITDPMCPPADKMQQAFDFIAQVQS